MGHEGDKYEQNCIIGIHSPQNVKLVGDNGEMRMAGDENEESTFYTYTNLPKQNPLIH